MPMAEDAADFDEDALGEAYSVGLAAEKRGDVEVATAAYAACLVIDPADHCGVRMRLAAFGRGEAPADAGIAYVSTLFDQHADDFEDILVRKLGYGVPGLLAERLARLGPDSFTRVLDLGCGTGLAFEALTATVENTTGVDLAPRMIEICDEKQLYDRLFVAEAVSFLANEPDPAPYDLIMATDVLPYLGDLQPFVRAAERRLNTGGLLAASTETMAKEAFAGRFHRVGAGQRFHHDGDYVKSVLSDAGLTVLTFEEITVRLQEGEPAPGHIFIARKDRSFG